MPASPAFSAQPATSVRILLVEDNPENMEILSAYLAQAGYLVDQATDGSIAFEMLKKDQNYDLVVTDRNMPAMDGLELFSQMKKYTQMHGIPVIMQTGATSPGEIIEGVKAGVFYYLTKPYEEEIMLALIKSALRDRQQRRQFSSRLSYQREALVTFMDGSFDVRNMAEVENIAFLLAGLFPRPELAVFGLYELLLNAFEHGMLSIGHEGKQRLLAESAWEEEIIRRIAMPENAPKKITVDFRRDEKQVEVIITDPGAGFDWRPFLEIEPSRATQANGRGIAKAAQLSFDRVAYKAPGNQVQLVTYLT